MSEEDVKDIFKLVTHQTEKESAFKDLLKYQSLLVIKLANETIVESLPFKIIGNQFSVKPLESKKINLENQSESIIQFSLAAEKYFMKTKIEVVGDVISFSTLGDLFLLQRRQNYRVKIPDSFHAYLDIEKINEDVYVKKVKLLDLSASGCRVLFEQKGFPLTTGDALTFKLIILSRDALSINGEVKNIKEESTPNKPSVSVGIEFLDLSSDIETTLFNLTTELYRELFSRSR